MFGRIRQRLTLLYTILTALALASFALVFYFGLTSLLMREQEREVTTYAAAVSLRAGEIIRKSERKRTDQAKLPIAIFFCHVTALWCWKKTRSLPPGLIA